MPLAPHPHVLIEIDSDGRANIYAVRVVRSGVAISEACAILQQLEQSMTARLFGDIGASPLGLIGGAGNGVPAAEQHTEDALEVGGYRFPIARSDPRIYAVLLLRYARDGSQLQKESGVKPSEAKGVVERAFKGVRGTAIAKSGIKDDARYEGLNKLIRPDESAPDVYWLFKVRANANFAMQVDDTKGELQLERLSIPVPGTREVGAMVLLAEPRRKVRKDWEKKHGTQLEPAKRLAQRLRAAMKAEPEPVVD